MMLCRSPLLPLRPLVLAAAAARGGRRLVLAAGRRPLASMKVVFVKDNTTGEPPTRVTIEGDLEGKSILDVAHTRPDDVELEGACDGACACSTCHVILADAVYRELEAPTDEEEDMLDLAFALTETSRLGCQVKLQAKHSGMEIRLPSATRNLYVDGHKPKPH